jgi:hypothetical protein
LRSLASARFRLVSALLLNVSGKVLKVELRRWIAERSRT